MFVTDGATFLMVTASRITPLAFLFVGSNLSFHTFFRDTPVLAITGQTFRADKSRKRKTNYREISAKALEWDWVLVVFCHGQTSFVSGRKNEAPNER